ncbi:MAG: rhodanese-like domain-containing protein [Magnetovibrionaceae bacterium]
MKTGVMDLVAKAEAEITTLEPDLVKQRAEAGEIVFVDIREPGEISREGMVPGAVKAPRGVLEFWVDPASPYHKPVFDQPDKTFVLYCALSWRSALATKQLQDMGFSNVAHIKGGFKGWSEAGGEIEKAEPK